MSRILPALALTVALLAPAAVAADTYAVDKAHSTLGFKILHLGIGYTYGRFNDFEGSFVIDETNLAASSVQLTAQVASVDTNDEKRDQHLKSPDFFNVKQFPTLVFKSTRVEGTVAEVRVSGDLTLHGVTKPVTLRMRKIGEGDDPWGNHRVGYEGQVVLKRSDFGMTHMLPGVGDEVTVTLAVEGIRK